MSLRIYNTLSRKKETFQPIDDGRVRMYVCGITSYAPSHIGHARALVAFDAVYRWLKSKYDVTYVRNFTDVDDKIIKAANQQGIDPGELAQRYIDLYREDAEALHCLAPTHEPRVTEHIQNIIDLVKRLEDRGFAYAVDGDVYFEVSKFPAYGGLSGRQLEEQEAGARVEVDTRKRAPSDFALWKSAKPGEPSWESPWGPGRPGWHIECSAMSSQLLGDTFDIHGGGKDLVFPHHENEVAQSCAASGKDQLANIWMHNGFVNLMPEGCPKCGEAVPEAEGGADSEPSKTCTKCGYEFTEEDFKMSKSRGNFFPIQDIRKQHEAEALRLLLLGSHYRSPIQFSDTLLRATETRLDKVYETLAAIDEVVQAKKAEAGPSLADALGHDPRARFAEAMDDDFNTAKAIADSSELIRLANDLLAGRAGKLESALSDGQRAQLLADIRTVLKEQSEVLGLYDENPPQYLARRREKGESRLEISKEEIERLIAARTQARADKNFARADEIRDELAAKGIVLKDGKGGTTWTTGE